MEARQDRCRVAGGYVTNPTPLIFYLPLIAAVCLNVVACVPFPFTNLHIWSMFESSLMEAESKSSHRAIRFIRLHSLVSRTAGTMQCKRDNLLLS